MIKHLSLFALFAALSSCATTQSTNLSPELQSRWDACEPAIRNWCHTQAHGDPAHETDCRREARHGYATLTDESLRARYLRDHGCAQ